MQRAAWVHQRIVELPQFAIFLYNILIDSRLPWPLKEHPFAALRYLFGEEGLIPNDDPALGRMDDAVMVLCCAQVLLGSVPPGFISIYEQPLARNRINVRQLIAEAPVVLGTFWLHLSSIYQELPGRHRNALGNAIATGALVRELQAWLGSFVPPDPDASNLAAIERFLAAYR